jgi:hypothetical protein
MKEVIIDQFKICSKCGKELPLYKFSFRTDTGKYRDQCKQCHKGYSSTLIDKQLEIDNLLKEGKKKCGHCGQIKLLEEFNKDKYTVTKHTSFCRDCIKIKGDNYRFSNQGKRTTLKYRHNISDKDLDIYLTVEYCEICGDKLTGKNKHLDHNHKTGKYRGALCNLCNTGLGHFKDNPELLILAAEYLKNK